MAFLVNLTRGTKVIGGVTLPPLGMGESNAPRKDLENHLFVRTGAVELSGGKSEPAKRGRKPKQAEPDPEPDQDDTPSE